jgi:hypothetical protein
LSKVDRAGNERSPGFFITISNGPGLAGLSLDPPNFDIIVELEKSLGREIPKNPLIKDPWSENDDGMKNELIYFRGPKQDADPPVKSTRENDALLGYSLTQIEAEGNG